MYMIVLAITALLSLLFVISHRFSRSRITVTRKQFSCSSQQTSMHIRNFQNVLTEKDHHRCKRIPNNSGKQLQNTFRERPRIILGSKRSQTEGIPCQGQDRYILQICSSFQFHKKLVEHQLLVNLLGLQPWSLKWSQWPSRVCSDCSRPIPHHSIACLASLASAELTTPDPIC